MYERDEALRQVRYLEEVIRGLRAELNCRDTMLEKGSPNTYRDILNKYKESAP
jgi:hypothetical protein